MNTKQATASSAPPVVLPASDAAPVLEVNISADLASVDVMHHGRMVTIVRNQDQGHSINLEYAKTSRKCPPFCIQPCELAPGVKTQLGAEPRDGFWNFDNAKTLVLFCNGSWCGQSPTTIKELLKIGYPAHKILWYRGGMQDWQSLGLTTLGPSGE